MAELERLLASLAPDIEWPETPLPAIRLEPARRRNRRAAPLVALAALVAAAVAAFAVPGARSAILRFLHLGGVTVERVRVAPQAPERPLTSDLGRLVDRRAAQSVLHGGLRLPSGRPPRQFYVSGDAVSVVLATPRPVLLTEFRSGAEDYVLKKIAAIATHVERLRVDAAPALWLTGKRHVLIILSGAPPRMAGNVLLWQARGVTYRLEGRTLTRPVALRLAREIERGT